MTNKQHRLDCQLSYYDFLNYNLQHYSTHVNIGNFTKYTVYNGHAMITNYMHKNKVD